MNALRIAVRKLGTAVRLLKEDRPRLLRKLSWRFETLVVFSAAPGEIPLPGAMPEVTLRPLTVSELNDLAPVAEEIRDAVERCHAFLGEGAAHGAFWQGKFAHLSWLISAQLDSQRLPPRFVKLRPGEAEITFCATLPESRGRRIYPFVIRSLFQLARERGIRRVYMITLADNVASQKGILAAGLSRRRGGIVFLRFLGMNLVWRYFRLWN